LLAVGVVLVGEAGDEGAGTVCEAGDRPEPVEEVEVLAAVFLDGEQAAALVADEVAAAARVAAAGGAEPADRERVAAGAGPVGLA
jgi:hypothetical protein